MKKIIFPGLVIFSLFFGIFKLANAQEKKDFADPSIKGEDIQQIELATVNIYNPKIVKTESDKALISFDIENLKGIQPEMRYAIKLVKKNKDQSATIFDIMVYDEVLNLAKNDKIHREITYYYRNIKTGEYSLYLMAINKNALSLSSVSLGDVNIVNASEKIEIDSNSCVATKINDIENKKNNSLNRGFIFNPGDNVEIACAVNNTYLQTLDAQVNVDTYKESVFGKKIKSFQLNSQLIEKGVGKYAFNFKVEDNQGTYENSMFLIDSLGKIVSNNIYFHYLIPGDNVAVQNVVFDKDYYKKDDVAKISTTILVSRFAKKTDSVAEVSPVALNIQAFLRMYDSENKICSDEKIEKFSENIFNKDVELKVINNCKNPNIKLVLKNAEGKILGEESYAVLSKNVQLGQEIKPVLEKNISNNNILKIFVGMFLVVISVIVYVFYRFRQIKNGKKGFKKQGLLLLLLFFGSFVVASNVSAADFVAGWGSGEKYRFALNVTPTTGTAYTAGDTMTIDSSIYFNPSSTCDAEIKVTVNGNEQTVLSPVSGGDPSLFPFSGCGAFCTYTFPSVNFNVGNTACTDCNIKIWIKVACQSDNPFFPDYRMAGPLENYIPYTVSPSCSPSCPTTCGGGGESDGCSGTCSARSACFNGACGTDHGKASSTKPTYLAPYTIPSFLSCAAGYNTQLWSSVGINYCYADNLNLCSIGSPNALTNSAVGPWTWQCLGSANPANCFTCAEGESYDPTQNKCTTIPVAICNSAQDKKTLPSIPVSPLCSNGVESAVIGNGDIANPWTWTCGDGITSSSVNCKACITGYNYDLGTNSCKTCSPSYTYNWAPVSKPACTATYCGNHTIPYTTCMKTNICDGNISNESDVSLCGTKPADVPNNCPACSPVNSGKWREVPVN